MPEEEQTGPKQQRRDALKGILQPLTIEDGAKAQIHDHVFKSSYTGKHLQGVLDPLEIDDATKANIWDLKYGRMPEISAPAPTTTPTTAPTGAAQRIQAAPAATIAPTPAEEAPLKAVPSQTPIGELPVTPEKLQTILQIQAPADSIPPVPGQVEEEQDIADRADLIIPKQESGYSLPLTVAGRPGRFNFNKPPVVDEGTPGPRYAFETEDGGTWMYHFVFTGRFPQRGDVTGKAEVVQVGGKPVRIPKNIDFGNWLVKSQIRNPAGIGFIESQVIDPSLVMLDVSTGNVRPEQVVPLLDFMDETAATKLRDWLADYEPNPYR